MRYEFENRLKTVMDQNAVSQKKLADDLGLANRQSISNYWKGTNKPNTELLFEICKTLKVSADYLLGLSDCSAIEEDIKVVNKTVGLSPKAINALVELKQMNDSPRDIYIRKRARDTTAMLNALLEDLSSLLADESNFIEDQGHFRAHSIPPIETSVLTRLYDWYVFLRGYSVPTVMINGVKMSRSESKEVIKVAKFNELSDALNEMISREKGEA